MSEMVERVARAMRKRRIELIGNTPADHVDEPNAFEIAIARAAIEAMREPADAMVEAGIYRDGGACGTNAIGVYQAMIDAALSEVEG